MYIFYFAEKQVIIDDDSSKYSPAEISRVTPGDPLTEKTKFLQKVQNTKRWVLITAEVEAVYQSIAKQFPVIEAAGGLVTNPEGGILMIFRHNRWDLPKGKLEPKESIGECAVREVAEECGIDAPQRERELGKTHHFYKLDGQWTMKRTTWYRMNYSGNQPLVPQTEEDITAIEWVNPAKLDHYLKTTYRTIVDVFESAGFYVK